MDKNELKTFRLNVSWKMFGRLIIQAASESEAIDIAMKYASLPEDSEYIRNSFVVDWIDSEGTEEQ